MPSRIRCGWYSSGSYGVLSTTTGDSGSGGVTTGNCECSSLLFSTSSGKEFEVEI